MSQLAEPGRASMSRMKTHIALLRAVNVGGTGKLPMADLRRLCVGAGFINVRTLLASGNVVLESPHDAARVKSLLEAALEGYAGKPVGVLVRSPAEMVSVLADNPFADAPPNRVVAIFLDTAPPADAISQAKGVRDERMVLGIREIYVHYGEGMADSKLRIPAAREGTARNLNTIARLVAVCSPA